ncbi:MAG: efflux RND transporter periplasmic adaptor subunit [Candidatus Cyclobacteriaceae bacterium M2_1C_046]
MKQLINIGIIALFLAACESEKDKVTQLEEYKKELKELQAKITELEKELDESDTISAEADDKAVLVSTLAIEKEEFSHMIEVRGAVESRRNVMISAEVPGRVDRVYVNEGDQVKKGQKLVELDSDVLRNRIATLKTQLELAETVFERQKRLWEKNIGTEIQYLEAKNRKETLERELSTAYSQLAQAVIQAPFNGIIDEIPAKEGEMMQPGMPVVRIVNPEQMYIGADVSEKYIGRLNAGDKVEIFFPSQDEIIESGISSVSSVINKENRTFSIEVKLNDPDFSVKPNQVVVVKLRDYKNDEAITVPTKIIRSDVEGSYVYTIHKENEELIARKNHITTGMTYNSQTEVLSGLKVGDMIIDKGINELADGVQVKLAEEKAVEAVRMAAGK